MYLGGGGGGGALWDLCECQAGFCDDAKTNEGTVSFFCHVD